VNLLRDLYARFRVLINEAAKFGIVGLLSFGVTIVGSNALHSGAGLGELVSVTIATTVATVLSFLGNKHWAFRHRKGNALHRESVLFFVCNGVGLLFQLAFVAAVQFGLGLKGTLAYNVANILGVLVATSFRLYTYRQWVFPMAGGEPLDAEHLQPETSGT
jgi:putative flippase GtrA